MTRQHHNVSVQCSHTAFIIQFGCQKSYLAHNITNRKHFPNACEWTRQILCTPSIQVRIEWINANRLSSSNRSTYNFSSIWLKTEDQFGFVFGAAGADTDLYPRNVYKSVIDLKKIKNPTVNHGFFRRYNSHFSFTGTFCLIENSKQFRSVAIGRGHGHAI